MRAEVEDLRCLAGVLAVLAARRGGAEAEWIASWLDTLKRPDPDGAEMFSRARRMA